MKNEIIIFENQNVKLEVNMKDDTVWLSLNQISKLFGRDKSVISRHLKKSFEEELDDSAVANFATTASDGKTYNVEYYNLDAIISVGYRVKSKNGIIFRKWVNKILKVIDNNTLTALTLLIVQTNPKEKDILVDLVTNFLN